VFILTVTSRGRVTLPNELLEHLGARAGDKLEVEKLPNGSLVVHLARS